MRFALQTPSLRHIAQMKIVAALLNQHDILDQISQLFHDLPFYYYYSPEEWKKWLGIEDQVKSKVSVLPLPDVCKKELLRFVKPLGMEIVVWWHYHIDFQSFGMSLPNQLLCWTVRGTVDYAKTAKLMVKDERVDVRRRYEIVCSICLEDEARELIKLIAEERTNSKSYDKRVAYVYRAERHLLTAYFTCTSTGAGVEHLAGQFQYLTTQFQGDLIFKNLFREMLFRGNPTTCEYFSEKLNPKEKEQVAVEFIMEGLSIVHEPSTCNVMHCLSQMNEEQQRHMIRPCSYDLLQCLLRWPMQSLFMEAAECGWSYMNKYKCKSVLLAITDKVLCGFEDYDYCQLFRECWRLSRDDCKRHFLFERNYLIMLIETKKEELIKLVFNEEPWYSLKKLVEKRYDEISCVLMDESAISDAALMECKEKAALDSLKNKEDEEKRLRSQYVSRLIDMAMENRIKIR